ncbi:ABC transporter, ATP-binding/permease components [Campylobacter blaseri]|uniref:ABC transporter ATP-binding protein/permease n=1 Tax=Campylobacter blaseri TaxID=2042961 RepID=A0A2P8R3S2_9BACT|nr:ABC transporter ATP-binding protein [Campylobacter blaseri]PSM53138.1 ABC transporter ATP-binding protein/permease [Campylobacter blaseri]PSM54604.1 ABC transporter ATP-binding protein/permease [Campylobacter blaseri]QKF86923.1 ABC transporter, ATP-binding/permease components [Campylobacter blaseri]
MKNKTKFSSLYELYNMFLEVSGKYKKEYKVSLYSGIIAIVVQALLLCTFYFLLEFVYIKDKESVSVVICAMLTLIVIFAIFKFKSSYYDHGGIFVDVGYDLRIKLGKKLTNIPLQSLGKYKTGDLNSVFASNVDESVMFMVMIPIMFLEPIITCFIIILVTLFINYKIAMLLMVILPITIPLYILKRKFSTEEKREFTTANANLESSIIEYIQGIGVLRSINRVGKNSKKLQSEIENVKKVQMKTLGISALPAVLLGTLIIFTTILTLFLAIYLNLQNEISIALVAALLVILSRLNEPFSILLSVATIFDLAQNGFARTKEILNMQELKFNEPLQTPNGFDIEFENVNFAYDGSDKNALTDINFKISQNTMTAIVGTSGSGKTTVIKMLMRYGDPQFGAVKIGGVDIKNITQNELMKHLSVVFQDVYLFNDTIFNNIKMGRDSASDEDIFKAAKMAFCDEFIKRLPQGYQTQIGDIGGNLSGGEKQRISIARAILKDSPIVILDEPTAALDTSSELAVQKAIDELVKNKTIIVIAHRLSTISRAEQILVFDDSNLVEKGTHDELLSKKTKYYKMWQAQQNTKTWQARNKL